MSTRSIGRGRCPRCGREGSVVIKWVGGVEYVYVKHGREWHYVGPLRSVDLGAILIEPTTPLPLKEGSVRGSPMSKAGRPLGKVLAMVFGIILMAIGVVLIISPLIAIPTYMGVSTAVGIGESTSIPINGSSNIVFIIALQPAKVSVTSYGATFRVATVQAVALLNLVPQVSMSGPIYIGTTNITTVAPLLSGATGNYTTYTTTLSQNQALLVWPNITYLKPALISVNLMTQPTQQVKQAPTAGSILLTILIMAPLLIIGIALIIGGYLLYQWSKKP